MSIRTAYVGEDVPITIAYEDDAGNAVDPDDQGTDGTPDADITIIDTSDDTEVVTAVAMTNTATGEFEHVWDTSTLAAGSFRVKVEAVFSGETKISKKTIDLR